MNREGEKERHRVCLSAKGKKDVLKEEEEEEKGKVNKDVDSVNERELERANEQGD
jgi:hypothetical protein